MGVKSIVWGAYGPKNPQIKDLFQKVWIPGGLGFPGHCGISMIPHTKGWAPAGENLGEHLGKPGENREKTRGICLGWGRAGIICLVVDHAFQYKEEMGQPRMFFV